MNTPQVDIVIVRCSKRHVWNAVGLRTPNGFETDELTCKVCGEIVEQS